MVKERNYFYIHKFVCSWIKHKITDNKMNSVKVKYTTEKTAFSFAIKIQYVLLWNF